MDFTPVIADLKRDKLAARRFEREGHRKFRDCVTVGRNGKLLFQRFCWGEGASLTFELWGRADENGVITWGKSKSIYDEVEAAPTHLAGYENGALLFEGDKLRWPAASDMKHWKDGGLGVVGKLFS